MENTTKLFAEVQAAYEVLSDPQERAWYDSHRDIFLHNEVRSGGEHYEHNIRITTAEDVTRMFMNFDGQLDYSDSPSGYFSTLGGIFDTLSREEVAASEWENLEIVQYPSFGSSRDSYEGSVRAFYAAWTNFATKKTFSWKDVFRYSEAPDRRVRRMMEKENKRFRDEGIREFNEAVRALVGFVKKRDPRYTPHKQNEAERQKILRDQTAAQAARSRAANEIKLKLNAVPVWARMSESQNVPVDEEGEEDAQEQYDCVVCKKTFKSEKQWEMHEKSKKHVKVVQHLRRKMRTEDEFLGLEIKLEASDINIRTLEERRAPIPPFENENLPRNVNSVRLESLAEPEDIRSNAITHDEVASSTETSSSFSNHEYASRTLTEDHVKHHSIGGAPISEVAQQTSTADYMFQKSQNTAISDVDEASTRPKIGKAKEKRAKKAALKTTITAVESKQEVCQ